MQEFKELSNNLDVLDEDMYAGQYGEIRIDVGFYKDIFRIVIYKGSDFNNQLEAISFYESSILESILDVCIKKIMSGYYDDTKGVPYDYEPFDERNA